eukprot:TRINITY_DN1496_c0_g1_i12.p1 TRINITY_DN1496_c0_g1~~TRINITY_DN1496_c0_g1_i12.p1  ORF type:complete len:197 (+),score=36.79 TRINITY_DN1496_c0_g1_i12:165-755(+)
MAHLTQVDYWDNFYLQLEDTRDWILENDVVLSHFLSNSSKDTYLGGLLHLGCGSSDLPKHLLAEGIHPLVNIDFSELIVERQRTLYSGQEGVTFLQMDVRDLKFEDGTFSLALDKGTFDCVVLGNDGPENARKMLRELFRVLKPNGKYFMYSLHGPAARLDLLHEIQWNVEYKAISVSPLELPHQTHTHLYICTKP